MTMVFFHRDSHGDRKLDAMVTMVFFLRNSHGDDQPPIWCGEEEENVIFHGCDSEPEMCTSVLFDDRIACCWPRAENGHY